MSIQVAGDRAGRPFDVDTDLECLNGIRNHELI